ncbi:rhamnogalacturonan acetylesterase [Uliginosibacterium paludis]|uniref:Rhamnogalacturonan acetylesterase n=1 Tax=Uliginosibacterium paludis TaxID=1615952 RepID=A0ABV2CRN5_9RHOO
MAFAKHELLAALVLPVSLMLIGAGCSLKASRPAGTLLEGVVSQGGPMANARVSVFDARGQKREARADGQGRYALDVEGMQAPLMLLAVEPGNDNCSDSARPWAKCFGALLPDLKPGQSNVGNLNALSDRALSSVASALKYKGPQALLDKGTTAGIDAGLIREKNAGGLPAVLQALKDAGVADAERFDPVTTPMKADGKGADAVLSVLVHNRGYDNDTGVPGGTSILDTEYRYVGNEEPLDLHSAQAALARIKDPAWTRVLIVGDSTASTYEKFRLPRMGWGQVFEELFKSDARVKVLNNAKSGRSSRNFYNQGYWQEMAQYLRPGDYVIIHHGHNDQNCDGSKGSRGAADVANLCTYPNDAQGRRQFPVGKPEMSFQASLETYVKEARARGAIPVIMTPTTRVWNSNRKEGFPVVPNHFTSAGQGSGGFAFTGDYSQTIRDTARANRLPLIDIEARTIAFANAHQSDWKNYWLAVDPAKYPWYGTQSSGTQAKPDTTHFQEAGARAVAAMVAEGIKETAGLEALAAKLR